MKLVAYLGFPGTCEQAFRFYNEVLGGRIEAMLRHEGTPSEQYVAPEFRKRIMHACLVVGDQMLMGGDAPNDSPDAVSGFSVSIHVESISEAERIFARLSEGGETIMPIGETFWSARFGMCRDRFGTPWMVNCAPAA